MEEVELSKALLGEILAHCRSVYPEEACGIIAALPSEGPSEVIPITNALHSPVRYQMDTREQFDAMKRLRREGMELWAIFHSHPMSEPYPSPTDLRLAFYPECYYLIAGLSADPPALRCFTIADGKVGERQIKTRD
jgi:proteasome lid subunit RPN8/RPN11